MSADVQKLSSMVTELGGDVDEALEEINIPVYVLGGDQRVRWQNGLARNLLGDLRGHFFGEIIVEGETRARAAFTQKMLGTARTTDYELVLRTVSGKPIKVEVHSTALAKDLRAVGVFGALEIRNEPSKPHPPPVSELTSRQTEVLRALAEGQSTRQMEATLGIATATVRNHVRAVIRGLGVHSRLAAVVEARRRGLVD